MCSPSLVEEITDQWPFHNQRAVEELMFDQCSQFERIDWRSVDEIQQWSSNLYRSSEDKDQQRNSKVRYVRRLSACGMRGPGTVVRFRRCILFISRRCQRNDIRFRFDPAIGDIVILTEAWNVSTRMDRSRNSILLEMVLQTKRRSWPAFGKCLLLFDNFMVQRPQWHLSRLLEWRHYAVRLDGRSPATIRILCPRSFSDDWPAVFHFRRNIFAEFVLVSIDFSFLRISLPRSSVDLEFDERVEVSPTTLWAIHSAFSTDQYEFHSFGFDSAYRQRDYSSLEMKKKTSVIRSTKIG